LLDAYFAYAVERIKFFVANPEHWFMIETLAAALMEHQKLSPRKV
jgi:hypothetical protein